MCVRVCVCVNVRVDVFIERFKSTSLVYLQATISPVVKQDHLAKRLEMGEDHKHSGFTTLALAPRPLIWHHIYINKLKRL